MKKTKEFTPGSFGFHELLDRTCLIAEQFSNYVAEHPSAKHRKLKKHIRHIERKLFALYGKIGSLHL